MVLHKVLGKDRLSRALELKELIKAGEVVLAGNVKLKIYGTLDCTSGKKMGMENRVFFKNADEALRYGYRPCGRCMKREYRAWKKATYKGF